MSDRFSCIAHCRIITTARKYHIILPIPGIFFIRNDKRKVNVKATGAIRKNLANGYILMLCAVRPSKTSTGAWKMKTP